MQHRIFFDHYRIGEDAAGSPEEIGRSGAAIVYKGIDTRSKEPVAIHLIPLASIDPATREQFEQRARSAQQLDHVNIARVLQVGTESSFLVLVAEFVEGETTDAWVVANGPMPPEPALRVGLEVVRALEASAFFSLTHRALQPSNIIIVPGVAPDGGWPFVKLLNFGLASAESHAAETPGAALAPAIAPQFASPEQLRDEPLDFRSEVYSLAATLCFLLTGAAPLTNGPDGRLRRFPEMRRLPRSVRNLLNAMLSEKPEHRPQDPIALEKEMRNCLDALERRQSFRQKLGIPMIAALPNAARGATPGAQILRGAIAFALLLLVAAGVTAAFFPGAFRFNRSAEQIGVPVGVPQPASSVAVAQNSATTPASAPLATPPPNVAVNQTVAPAPAPTTQPSVSPTIVVANTATATESQAPAEGPDEESSTASNTANNQETNTNRPEANESARADENDTSSDETTSSHARSKTKRSIPVASSRRARIARDNDEDEAAPRRETYSQRPNFRSPRWLGQTSDGRRILRLPSGRVVVITPGRPDQDYGPVRRRVIVRQPGDDEPPPLQPFDSQPRD